MAAPSASKKLPTNLKLAFALGAVPFGVKDIGLQIFLLLYYNQILGLPASWVGLAVGLALVVDAMVDPLIGYWSDNLRSRWGRRHPFLYVALIPIAIAYGLLWDPPSGLSQPMLLLYLTIMAVLVRVLTSLYEVPSAALTPDLTDDYDERTSIVGYRIIFGLVGGIGLLVVALIAFLRPNDGSVAGQLVAAGYVKYGWTSAIIMAVTGFVSALGTHRRIPLLKPAPPQRAFQFRRSIAEIIQSLSHPSLRLLLAALLFASLAGGLTSTLGFYYNTYFWELSPPQILVLVLALFPAVLVARPLAVYLTRRYGKKAGAAGVIIAALVIGPLPPLLRLAGWFPDNGAPSLIPILFGHAIIAAGLAFSATILVIAMVTDIVEESELTTGRRSEGLFLAGTSLVGKCATGLGLLISGVLIDAIHFPQHATPGAIDPAILRNLVLYYTPLTTILYILMLGFLSTYRIDRARHEMNLRRLVGAE